WYQPCTRNGQEGIWNCLPGDCSPKSKPDPPLCLPGGWDHEPRHLSAQGDCPGPSAPQPGLDLGPDQGPGRKGNVPPTGLLVNPEPKAWHNCIEMIEDVGLDSLVLNPSCACGETVDFQGNPLR